MTSHSTRPSTTDAPTDGTASTTANTAARAARRTPSPLPDARTGARADGQDKLRAVHDRLTAAIADLTRAENWQLMLRTAAKLPTYSPHNVLLITSQCPQASAVAGFHTWKQLGRSVRKGEKGIAILAPVHRRVPAAGENAQPDAGERPESPTSPAASAARDSAALTETGPTGSTRVAGFRVVHVFDISQTDGPDVPEPPRPELLEGHAPAGLLDGLTRQVQEQGYELIRHAFDLPHPGVGAPNGVTDYFARTVIIRPDLSEAQTVKTLAHELGHVLLHEPGRRPEELTRRQAEVEAESVAHVVAEAHGLDTRGYTIPYVAGWSEGDLELLARAAERVVSTAHQILTQTPPAPTFLLTDTSLDRHQQRQQQRTQQSRPQGQPERPHQQRLSRAGLDRTAAAEAGEGRVRDSRRVAQGSPRSAADQAVRQGRLW